MLVLTRNKGQSIIINGNIEVTIVGVEGNKVKVAVEAPREVRIDRKEIHKKREKEGQQ